MNLGDGVTWDADLRYVGKLHDPGVPEYVELNTRLGWKITSFWDVSLSGLNLLHASHPEFAAPGAPIEEIPRSFLIEARWRF